VSSGKNIEPTVMKSKVVTIALLIITAGLVCGILIAVRSTKTPNSQQTPAVNQTEVTKRKQKSPYESLKESIPLVKKHERMRKGAEAFNVNIDFWGKIVDENDQPIEGASVSATVREWGMGGFLRADGRHSTNVLISADGGLFSLRNARGDSLTIESVVKDGYKQLRPVPSFIYERGVYGYKPDSNKPVVIKMIKQELLRVDELRIFNIHKGIRCDGTPLIVDTIALVSREGPDAQGELQFSFVRSPKVISTEDSDHQWQLEIKIQNGGLIIADEYDPLLMWQAPLSGYKDSHSVSLSANDSKGLNAFHLSFYFKVNDHNHFGRCSIKLNSGMTGDKAGIRIEGAVNSSGSRIVRRF
jgi:hypothetical protein